MCMCMVAFSDLITVIKVYENTKNEETLPKDDGMEMCMCFEQTLDKLFV